MAFNGAGVFLRLYSWVNDKAGGIKITASRMDAEFDGIATGLTNCITRDGQTTPTANIPLGGNKITGLGTPTNAGDAATKAYTDNAVAAALVANGDAIFNNMTVNGVLSANASVAGGFKANIASGSNGIINGTASGLLIVRGVIASNEFQDLVMVFNFGAKTVISSYNFGSPPTRTYSDSSGSTRLALAGGAAGTYSIYTLFLQV